jgi:glucose/arabinose dehydrogenase
MKRGLIMVFFVLGIVKGAFCQDDNLQLVIEGLKQPTDIAHTNDGSGRLYVLEKAGIVKVRNGGEVSDFLDISEKVFVGHMEMGLLGIAFHPDYASNGLFFLNYTAKVNGAEITRISRFEAIEGGQAGDIGSEEILLEFEQPYGNHNGGALVFGEDGYLYIASGDGGSAGDPQDKAQSLGTLLGKVLRIDVDNGDPYAIPEDNPFVGTQGAREEIYAYGLRNPWKITRDRETGEIWIADVGQNHREVINKLEAGGNYGWNIMEGSLCYPPGTDCEPVGIAPLYEYSIQNENCSVTGGYVYRGEQIPALVGQYVFGDFCSGNVWALSYEGGEVRSNLLFQADFRISTFGEDEAGEILIGDFQDGNIYRLTQTVAGLTDDKESSIFVYPNPSRRELFVKTEGENPQRISISDNYGKTINAGWKEGGDNVFEIECADLVPGLYMIDIVFLSGKHHIQKVMVME